MTAASIPSPSRAAFAFVFVTILLDMLALGLVIPILPRLVEDFLGGDAGRAAAIVGWFGTAWAFMQFVFQPVLGGLSDRFGRRPVIVLSNLGLGLDYVLMALAPSLWFLFVGRLISGITAASYSTAAAYIADVSPPEKRAARFGLLGAAFGLGFVVGPAVGGWLGTYGLRVPFWAAAGVSLANGLYGLFVLPESLPRERRTGFRWAKANPVASLGFLRASPILSRLALAGFLQRLAHTSLPSMFVLYADYRYGWGTGMTGIALAIVGASQMVVSGLLVRPAIARLGEYRALLLGLLSEGFGLALFGFAANGTVVLIALAPIALSGLINPALQSLQTRAVGPSEQGRLQGAQSSLGGIADMIGPLMFTHVFAAAILAIGAGSAMGLGLAGAPYLLAAILLGASLLVCRQTRNTILPAAGIKAA